MSRPAQPRVVFGFLFYPRGGSAHVARALLQQLADRGWRTSIASGSLRTDLASTEAATFFDADVVQPLHYDDALAAAPAEDPLTADPPMHPSYEHRPAAPDRIFTSVDPRLVDHHAATWRRHLRAAGLNDADVTHLHHLTPMHEAVRDSLTPVVSHLHGTELNLIRDIVERADILARSGLTFAAAAEAEPAELRHRDRHVAELSHWPVYRYAAEWLDLFRRWAAQANHTLVLTDSDAAAAVDLLHLEPSSITVLPNGVDGTVFHPRVEDDPRRRGNFWRDLLCRATPADLGMAAGELSSSAQSPERLAKDFPDDAIVIVCMTRFLRFKRVDVLLEAYRRARPDMPGATRLIIAGGFQGELEGEHPAVLARRLGLDDVCFTGWLNQDDLASAFRWSDLFVSASREPFGMVFLQAMASGVPIIGTDYGGPRRFIPDPPAAQTGWRVRLDDPAALAAAMVAAIADPVERSARGQHGRRLVQQEYSWPSIGATLDAVYADAARW